MALVAGEAPETRPAAAGPRMDSVVFAELAITPALAGHQMDLADIVAPATILDTLAHPMALAGHAAAEWRAMRAISAIVVAILLASPLTALGADGRGWQGWAFELRGEGPVGWVGAWTPGACEMQRQQAIEAKLLDASIGPCNPVTLSDGPAGIPVWAVMRADDGFVAASSPAICEPEDDAPGPGIRPASLVSTRCLRAWILVPA
jgi:hypothetical protein